MIPVVAHALEQIAAETAESSPPLRPSTAPVAPLAETAEATRRSELAAAAP